MVGRTTAAVIGVLLLAGGLLAPAGAQAPPGAATPQAGASSEAPLGGRKVVGRRVIGTVKSVTATSLVVTTVAGGQPATDWTFLLDPATRVRKGDQTVPATVLAEQDRVRVAYKDVDGQLRATVIVVTAKRKS